jgi:hypothetical protein
LPLFNKRGAELTGDRAAEAGAGVNVQKGTHDVFLEKVALNKGCCTLKGRCDEDMFFSLLVIDGRI